MVNGGTTPITTKRGPQMMLPMCFIFCTVHAALAHQSRPKPQELQEPPRRSPALQSSRNLASQPHTLEEVLAPLRTSGELAKITSLQLSQQNLEGPIPPWLGTLNNLREIHLRGCHLLGSIPPDLGNLTQLQVLDLSDNDLEGAIPATLGKLTSLVRLNLGSNRLTGSLPAELGNLQSVEELTLGDNFLSGSIPSCLWRASALRRLDLGGNLLSGEIPPGFESMKLESLWLSTNQISGPIPEGLWYLTSLKNVMMSNNHLSGEIPAAIGQLFQLEVLLLSNNQLSGRIPTEIRYLPLRGLDLASNNLEGEIPPELGEVTSLENLYLANNALSGPIPGALGNLRALRNLELGNNSLKGNVSDTLWQIPTLVYVSLDSNQLGPDVGNFTLSGASMNELRFSNNFFAGELPADLSPMAALHHFHIEGNPFLTGAFPATAGCSIINTITASGCSFTSVAPQGATLQHFDLTGNQLTSLPESIRALTQLEVLKLESNRIRSWPLSGVATAECSGELEAPRFNWYQLRQLTISNNPLQLDAQHFLDSLGYLDVLLQLEAANCSLQGQIRNLNLNAEAPERCKAGEKGDGGFESLELLDLSSNQITDVTACPPERLEQAIFRDNHLRSLSSCWLLPGDSVKVISLEQNPRLHVPVVQNGSCDAWTVGLVADPISFKPVDGTNSECTSLCPQKGDRTIRADGWTLDSNATCRCSPGSAGRGIDCTPCPKNTYSVLSGSVAACYPCGRFQITWKAGSAGPFTCVCDKGLTPLMIGGQLHCRCDDDQYLTETGACVQCPALTATHPDDTSIGPYACHLKRTSGVMVVQAGIILLLALALYTLPLAFGLPPSIITDASLVDHKVTLTTSLPHLLMQRLHGPVPVELRVTGHPGLDRADLSAWRVSSSELWLFDRHGKVLQTPMNTSMGYLRVRFPHSLLRCGWGFVPASAVTLLCLSSAVYLMRISRLPPTGIAAETSFGGALALLLHTVLWHFGCRTPLALQQHSFRQMLLQGNPRPVMCPPGPGRAISAKQLTTFYEFFRAFLVNGRDMYYVSENIMKPLTAPFRLSYSELAGPQEVTWFVSHYWGHPFQQFVSAVLQHAQSLDMWEKQNYWICSFSNNQWALHLELGGSDWTRSSFYQALSSPGCKATLMVLDKEALPLTRAWCLFEVLHTMLLAGQRDQFEGLLLGTETGVLNAGSGSMDAAMGLAEQLSVLDVQDAKATSADDLAMIHGLVQSMDGGFDAVNSFVRSAIHEALEVMYKSFSENVGSVMKTLADSSDLDLVRKATSKSVSLSRSFSSSDELAGSFQSSSKKTRKPRLPFVWIATMVIFSLLTAGMVAAVVTYGQWD